MHAIAQPQQRYLKINFKNLRKIYVFTEALDEMVGNQNGRAATLDLVELGKNQPGRNIFMEKRRCTRAFII